MAIKKVSEESLYNIKRKSAKALPDKPSAQGYSAEEIKSYLTDFVIDDNDSFKAELDRIVDEINEFISGIDNINLKNYIIDTIIAKFTEQNPILSLNFNQETKLLEYSRFLNQGAIDILPNDAIFVDGDVLKNKQGSVVNPKTSIDKLIDLIDNKTVREYIVELNSKIETLLSKHDSEISTINSNIAAIIGGDAPKALDSIKELAEALNNNPSQVDDILLQIENLKNNKVDKVDGKQLTTNDYSNEDKAFIDSLKTKNLVEQEDLKTDLKQFNDDSKHRLVTDEEKQYWSGKEDKGHNHEIEDVNGLKEELDSKSSSLHTHTPEEIGAEKTGVAKNLLNNHNSNKESHEDIRKHINDVEKKVDGINQAISFYNESQLTDWIAGTYTRTDGKTVSDLFVGQHIYIEEQDERDFWVKETPVTSINNLAELVTDKILLEDYSLKEDLADVATSGSYKHLKDTPTIYYKLSEMTSDQENRTISDKKLEQIDTNTRKIEEKIDKNLGSSEANKMIVTDENGNIIAAEAGSMSILVNNLESTSTTMAPTANMVRELNNIKLNKQQGTDNSGKHLVVNDEGLIGLENQKTKLSEFENDKKFATEDYVNVNGGKIDTIKVKGTVVNPVQKVVDLDVPTNDEFKELLEEVAEKQEQLSENQLLAVNSGADAGKINQIEANRLNIENLKNDKVDKVSGKGLSTNDFTNDDKNKLDSLENYVDDALRVGISDINSKIPDTASSTNKLADQAFVNSSIATNTATFRQTHNSYDELPTTGVDEQDYAFVKTIDASGNTVYKRYKYTNGKWEFEYELNNSSFTAQQWASINSEITKDLKEQIVTNKNNISSNESNISANASSITNLQNDKEDKSNLKKLAYKDGLTANEVGAIPKTEKPNINGNNNYTSNNNFYAPTAKGNYGQVLMSNGADAPSWTNMPDIQGSVTLKSLLPLEYQEVEYVECDGNQYIDTGVISNGEDFKMEGSTYASKNASKIYNYIFSSKDTIDGIDGHYFYPDSNRDDYGMVVSYPISMFDKYLTIYSGGLFDKFINWSFVLHKEHREGRKDKLSVLTDDGTQYSAEYTSTNNVANAQIVLFNYNGNAEYSFVGKAGKFKIYIDGVIQRDFIPCYRKEDGVIGYYDLLNGTFYENQGTSPFVKGADAELDTVKQYQFMAQNIYLGNKTLEDTYVPLSRTISGKTLGKDIQLELKDIKNFEWYHNSIALGKLLEKEYYKTTNILPVTGIGKTVTLNGVDFTRNADGSITMNGTATNYGEFRLNKFDDEVGESKLALDENKTYRYSIQKISGSITGRVSEENYLNDIASSGIGFRYNGSNNSGKITSVGKYFDETGYYELSHIYITFISNYTYDNFTIGIRVEEVPTGGKTFLVGKGGIVHQEELKEAIESINTVETDPTVPEYVKTISEADISNWNGKANDKDLSTVAKSGSYNDLSGKPTIPDVSSFITKDVDNLTNYTLSTGVGTKLGLSINTSTYVMTITLKNSSGTTLDTQTVDLPLESMVIGATYNKSTKEITLTLQNGTTTSFSVADLVSGLATQSALDITNTNVTNLQNNKANTSDLGELAYKDNLSKSDIGLGNVDNTSDLSKPISTATQNALNLKANNSDLSQVAKSGSYNDLSNKPTLFSGNYNDLSNKPTIPDTSGFVPNTRTINGKALSSNISLGSKDVGALPDYTLTISHQSAGNPRMVKFASVNYSSAATCFKMGAMTCHDNGVSYQFLTDMLIAVTTAGEVTANIYKFAQSSIGNVDGVARYTGDVFYVNDTTNKIVDFYILCGQWSASQFTPVTKVGSTTISYVTQYSGSATYYSSGDKVWSNGCGTTYARTSDIPDTSSFVTTNTEQTITGKKIFSGNGLTVSGRTVGGGDDEGIVVSTASNSYAGLCLGSPSGMRSVFYLNTSNGNAWWRYNAGGATSYDLQHPKKSGTIATTDDLGTQATYSLSGTTLTITPK